MHDMMQHGGVLHKLQYKPNLIGTVRVSTMTLMHHRRSRRHGWRIDKCTNCVARRLSGPHMTRQAREAAKYPLHNMHATII
jgi:hypothetical protein